MALKRRHNSPDALRSKVARVVGSSASNHYSYRHGPGGMAERARHRPQPSLPKFSFMERDDDPSE